MLLDQHALPLNPANSVTLKAYRMVIPKRSNPSSVLSEVKKLGVGANHIQRVGKIEKEANVWGNAQNMLTFSR